MDNKIKELQQKMPAGVDSFLSLDEKTVLYLTGFTMNDGALFVTRYEKRAVIHSKARKVEHRFFIERKEGIHARGQFLL
jgi:hypothetical protein